MMLCLAKPHSTENRELAPPELQLVLQACTPVKIHNFSQNPCRKPSLHHLKYHVNAQNHSTNMATSD